MQITTYHEARKYLESFITTSAAVGETAAKLPPTLERIQLLLKLLGNPQEKFRSIQVSGTAGKGSTSYLIAQMVTNAGYKTGLTISPHLEKLNERIQINNSAIEDDKYIHLLNEIIPAVEHMKQTAVGVPTYLEILIAMAFTYFAQEKVDIAVVEVGLEGRFDGTNTLSPLIAVITNIHLDHTELLGDTVEKIAQEAVSIIKSPNQVTIIGNTQPSVHAVIAEKVKETGGILQVMGKDFSTRVVSSDNAGTVFNFISGDQKISHLKLQLLGAYQVENAALAIETILQLNHRGFTISEAAIRRALTEAFFPGRFERIAYQGREVILDGAHNPLKMHSFLTALDQYYPERKKTVIITFKKGKAITDMLREVVGKADTVILTEFHSTLDADKNASAAIAQLSGIWKDIASVKPIQLLTASSVAESLSLACKDTSRRENLIVVTGSLYLVGEMRGLLRRN